MNRTATCQIVTAVLVLLVGADRCLNARPPAGVAQYFDRVRAAAHRVPNPIGAWVGTDVPVPPQAVALLDPNVFISRTYVDVEDGTTARMLFVHCSDAHQIWGHYPPRCLSGRGWKLDEQRPREWVAGTRHILGTEYRFRTPPGPGSPAGAGEVVVVNCLLRPGGRILRDMTGLTESARGAAGPRSGAGQVQLYFDASVPPEQRDAAVTALLEGHAPLLDAILSDVQP